MLFLSIRAEAEIPAVREFRRNSCLSRSGLSLRNELGRILDSKTRSTILSVDLSRNNSLQTLQPYIPYHLAHSPPEIPWGEFQCSCCRVWRGQQTPGWRLWSSSEYCCWNLRYYWWRGKETKGNKVSHSRLTSAAKFACFQAGPPLFNTKRTKRHLGIRRRMFLQNFTKLNFLDSSFSSAFWNRTLHLSQKSVLSR